MIAGWLPGAESGALFRWACRMRMLSYYPKNGNIDSRRGLADLDEGSRDSHFLVTFVRAAKA